MLDSVTPLYSVSGFAVGLLVGVTGVGGGSLMAPLLVLLFGINPTTAVGTDLLYASVTKSVGTLVHGARATIDWRVTAHLAIGSIPATIVTIIGLHQMGSLDAATARLVTVTLGGALVLAAITTFGRRYIVRFASNRFAAPSDRRALILTIALGVLLGIMVSLTSVGAGAIGATALLLLYPRLPAAKIIGSDIAHAVPLTLVAGVGHWLIGSIDWQLLGSLLCGSIPGIVIGSLLAAAIPEIVLRPALASLLLLVGSRMVV